MTKQMFRNEWVLFAQTPQDRNCLQGLQPHVLQVGGWIVALLPQVVPGSAGTLETLALW